MYRRLNITLPDEVLRRADEFAVRERYTRSGLIAAALEAYVTGGIPGLAGAAVATEPVGVAYAPESAPAPTLDRVRDLLQAFLAARDDVEAAWVFGSITRGTAGPLSDVDVAVLPAAQIDAESRWALRQDLSSRLPGVLGVSEVDVAVLPDVSVSLGFDIATGGEQVFGLGSRRAAEAMACALTEYWDYQHVVSTARDALGERMRSYAEGE